MTIREYLRKKSLYAPFTAIAMLSFFYIFDVFFENSGYEVPNFWAGIITLISYLSCLYFFRCPECKSNLSGAGL